MKTQKNKNNFNKTLKNQSFLKPKTLWQKRLKIVADRDLSLIPNKIDSYKIFDTNGLIISNNNNIEFLFNNNKKSTKLDFHSNQRIYFIKNFLKNIKNLPNVIVPFKFGDSYMYDYNGPYFCWAKPMNKNGLLFPHWNFENWNSTVRKFKDSSIPWNERKQGPFFRGNKNSFYYSQIREKLVKYFPTIYLDPPFDKASTEMCEYKYIFDLPGSKPWSIRSPLAELSQAQIIRPLLYYSKWNEQPWVQFYEYKEPNGLKISINYEKSLPDNVIQTIVDYSNKFMNKRSLHKSDLSELSEEDIHYYIRYLFHHLQKYNKYFMHFLKRK